jgi:hypothetical protein
MTKLEKLWDLFSRADVTLSYWDGKRRGAVERELTTEERMMIIRALRRSLSVVGGGAKA